MCRRAMTCSIPPATSSIAMVAIVLTMWCLSACSRYTATAPTSGSDSGTISLASVTSIRIVPDTDVLRMGETQQFDVAAELGSGAPPSGPLPLWISSNPSVLLVAQNGLAAGLARGEAVVQVSFRGQTASRRVQVTP
jgi:uncharacterized protein YjdB